MPGGEDQFPDEVVLPIEDSLDLHAFAPRDVAAVVESYLDEAARAGMREVRIIHGRGIGVQREIVRAQLARHPRVASFGDGGPGRGGWGATLVRLRDA
jgi:dsDNA-specific endonuclease/ATPase MutS2